MLRCCLLAVLIGCGGGPRAQAQFADEDEPDEETGIQIEPKVAGQRWYHAAAICGQGPYEIELPLSGVKWGEEVSFAIVSPRRIAFTAIVLGDDEEVAKVTHGERPENARCVADAKERLAAVRSGGGGGGTVTPGVPVGTTIIPPPQTPVPLVIDDDPPDGSTEVLRYRVREGHHYKRLRIRLWSVAPNDLDRVRFGLTHIEWRPNVSEAEYAAYLVRRAERDARRARRRAARAAEIARVVERARQRELEAERNRPRDLEAEARDEARRRADEARRLAEEERRRVRDLEKQREAVRKRALDAALALDRQRRREAYCAAHPESRDCWGAGGKRRWAELEALAQEKTRYCAANTEDVRCWSPDERARRNRVWDARFADARIVKGPDGPPPAPRDETPPPRLSDNAEWRPGYWQWTGATWFWLGGMWRVPDEDIVAEKTTTAPIAPPPQRVEEVPPPPPSPAIVWVTGFWQWNGSSYIWVAGSYQPRPAGATWRPTEWRVRGSVHILVPGGWIRGGRR